MRVPSGYCATVWVAPAATALVVMVQDADLEYYPRNITGSGADFDGQADWCSGRVLAPGRIACCITGTRGQHPLTTLSTWPPTSTCRTWSLLQGFPEEVIQRIRLRKTALVLSRRWCRKCAERAHLRSGHFLLRRTYAEGKNQLARRHPRPLVHIQYNFWHRS